MAIESKMHHRSRSSVSTSSPTSRLWLWILLAMLAIVILWMVSLRFYPSLSGEDVFVSPVVGGLYQAVFLDNGQVYFGTLERTSSDFYLLRNVFYFQSGTGSDPSSSLALTKLGSEAHGPMDHMEINKDHILFIEDLKDDSKVVQAIEAFKTQY